MELSASFFSRLLRVFRTSPAEITPELPMSILDTKVWSNLLFQLYTEESSRGEASRARLGELLVVEIRRYRESLKPEHEFVVTKVHADGSSRYLRLDRILTDHSSNPSIDSGDPATSVLITTDTAAAITDSNSSLVAVDTVAPLSGWPSERGKGANAIQLIDKIKLVDSNPTLLDLALVADITHRLNEEYRLFKQQSFWYASLINQSLQRIAKVEHAHASKDDEFDEVQDKTGGWKPVKILDILPKQINAVWDSYEAQKTTLLTQISDADKSWKDMMKKAADYSVQKRLKEEALQREQIALKEKELALQREDDVLRREQELLREIEDIKQGR